MKLAMEISAALDPLFSALPTGRAMAQLVVRTPAAAPQIALVESLVTHPAIARKPALLAGLWLYVDELDRSHRVSQEIHDTTGSFWHGIMHRREGDFSNSHYWFHRVGAHPVIDTLPDYDPHAFIDAVARSHRDDPADLVALQRREWETLFLWSSAH